MAGIKNTFIIAEAGVNHNGSREIARELVIAAADAGADAVKFQTFSADKLVLQHTPKAEYQSVNTRDSCSQFEMLKALELSSEAHFELKELCRENRIEFMSSPFDCASLRFLVEDVGVERLKIPSGEMINGPLILAAARTGLPLILSSGMCTLADVFYTLSLIEWAVRNPYGHPASYKELENFRSVEGWMDALGIRTWLLQCVSQYPTPPSALNLRAIEALRNATGLRTGLSDHSMGWHLPVAAVAAGARIIEKHFTLSRRLPGPDHIASLEPDELRRMVSEIRDVEAAMGSGEKCPTIEEQRISCAARGSIVTACPIKAGELFTTQNLTVKRPGSGVSPLLFWDVVGSCYASRGYAIDEQISPDEVRQLGMETYHG